MPIRKRVVRMKRRRQPPPRRWCGIAVGDIVQFLSSLLLPLMLGVFTVVITFQQQKLAQDQRIEDKEEMRLQREQDINESQLLREQDRNETRLQREQDRNETRLQREQEWNIAQIAQAAQTKANSDRYQDELLVAYIKEISDLLKENNGSLTTDSLTGILARAKTLNTIRQLDGARQSYVLRFLQEAGQLINRNNLLALDISTAELRDIDFRRAGQLLSAEGISLAGVRLVNSTFSGSWIKNVNFLFAELRYINFSSARLNDVNFSYATLTDVNFSSADFGNVNFSSARLGNVNFSSATFIHWGGPNQFDHAILRNAVFEDCSLYEADFPFANLKGSSFRGAIIDTVDFSHANLEDADLTNTEITDKQLQSALSIRNAKLPNGTLGQGRNFVRNGDAHCNISLLDHWRMHNGSIAVTVSSEDPSQCRFSLQSPTSGATMSQRIDLVDIWDSTFWTFSNAELRAEMSDGVSIELIGQNKDGEVVDKAILNSTNNNIRMNLYTYFQVVVVVVEFSAQPNQSGVESSWCDNIELFINYDSY